MRRSRVLRPTAAVLLLLVSLSAMAEPGLGASSASSGFRALSGADALAFQVPGDVRLVWEVSLPGTGLTQARYQQVVGKADVFGGQLTVLRRDGQQVGVIGAYYPGLTATNRVRLTPADAERAAAIAAGAHDRWVTTLAIHPATGRQFYIVDARSFDSRWVVWIDAENGTTLNKYSAIMHTEETDFDLGAGVKGDTKQLDTTFTNGVHTLVAGDGRQATYDARNRRGSMAIPGALFTDPDGTWDTAGTTSPGHPAAVDAHYYANVADDFYQTTFGRDSFDDAGAPIVSSVHYGARYNNAFWNGEQSSFGDGDGQIFREFSGGLDVVAHELTHGVTQFTSGLIYEDEPGALNEAFSDMMGNTAEYFAAANGLDPTVTPDLLVGEDIDVRVPPDAVPGLRNMCDPAEDGDPDHYSELYTGTQDNGGVHSNSGIPNHAYCLLVNGGSNAGEARGHDHTGPVVTGIGIDAAAQIFYLGFTSLPQDASMANASFATEVAADALFGSASLERASTSDAWEAVGVTATPPGPGCVFENVTIPFESTHPYDSDSNCTWIYDNGSPNFRFNFSLLDVESGFDFIDILDADGNVLETITGTFRSGYTSVTVPTSVGMVRLRTDSLINKRGFIVDAVIQQ